MQRVLIVKLSSLGDVVHTMPAIQDIRRALPSVEIDWVVEQGFMPLVMRCAGVREAIPSNMRQWRNAPLAAETRRQWRRFRNRLSRSEYDAVIDAQGLAKSALVARLARLAPGGRRYALANRTRGSSYEAPTRWAADVAIAVDPELAAVSRTRVLCARALGFDLPAELPAYGLVARTPPNVQAPDHAARCVVFVHGSSRADKSWPVGDWIALGQRLNVDGWRIGLPHGNEDERRIAVQIAAQLSAADVWPRLPLDALVDRMDVCAGVIGVDSGLSHIAVALDLPHVQLYNHDTAWRTGPGREAVRQQALFASPAPTCAAVWQAWAAVAPASPTTTLVPLTTVGG